MGIMVMSLLRLLLAVLMIAMVSADDKEALLAFKAQVGDTGSPMLASWNGSAHFCSWQGVTCSHRRPARVVELRLNSTGLTGALRPALGNLTFLRTLDLSFNWLNGEIPASLGRLQRLQGLYLNDNKFSGTFPVNLSSCISMIIMGVHNNQLGGRIPGELGEKLVSLEALWLKNNSFTGPIPASLANLSYLQNLDLSNNQLVGSIPPGLGSIHSMWKFNLFSNNISGNNLSGKIPDSIQNCIVLDWLLLDNNSFEGSIPQLLKNIKGLSKLNLTMNKFSGSIPEALGDIGNLQELYLAHKNLTGLIPAVLQNLTTLSKLDVSFNNLQGEVPHGGVFRNITYIAVAGNVNLCGRPPHLHLAPCSTNLLRNNKTKMPKYLAICLATTGAILFSLSIILVVWVLRQKLKRRQTRIVQYINAEEKYERIPYQVLFTGTNGFSEANLLGRGSYGAVYKCDLDSEDRSLAVKVFNLQHSGSSKSFQVECETMRRIRHRRLTKIITCCSSVDDEGREFKALVFEYLPNGNLDHWLHQKSQEPTTNNTLSLSQRLDIAVDIVDAVEYLHNYCEPPVIHCDLKPSNILLAEDMSARVGDFGISKILQDNTRKRMEASYSSIGIRGSIGYVAPEYGQGSVVATYGDIYSIGILLLEMFTGRSPTDDTFRDSLGLHNFAGSAIPERTLEIADPTIWLHREPKEDIKNSRIQECLVSVFKLGISCSKRQPQERTLIRDAAGEMHAIRDAYLLFAGKHIGEHGAKEEPLLKRSELE